MVWICRASSFDEIISFHIARYSIFKEKLLVSSFDKILNDFCDVLLVIKNDVRQPNNFRRNVNLSNAAILTRVPA